MQALMHFSKNSQPHTSKAPDLLPYCVEEPWHIHVCKHCSRLWRELKKPIPAQASHFLFACFGGHAGIACICARKSDPTPAKPRSAAMLCYLIMHCLFAQALLEIVRVIMESIWLGELHFLCFCFDRMQSGHALVKDSQIPHPAKPQMCW